MGGPCGRALGGAVMTAVIINLADRRAALAEPAPPKPKPTILELIQGIADDLGIDIEAPFRQRPGARPFAVPPKPGDKRPPKPRRDPAP